MSTRTKLWAAVAGWAILLLLMVLWKPAAADEPIPLRAVIDCGSLEGRGTVNLFVADRYRGSIRIECRRT